MVNAPVTASHRSRKVPEVRFSFWGVKLLTTAMGEAVSDFLVYHMNPYLAVGLGALLFVVALFIQITLRRYRAVVYWTAVTMVAVFGTMAADATHIVLGVPYLYSSLLFAVALTAVFLLWYRSEGTLSIHTISTQRREIFYWLAVMASFAMGTALGDLTAFGLHAGLGASVVIYAVLFSLPWLTKKIWRSETAAFWFSYVMTRPLGASLADWMDMPHHLGGLGWGRGTVGSLLSILLALAVAWVAVKKIDTPDPQATE